MVEVVLLLAAAKWLAHLVLRWHACVHTQQQLVTLIRTLKMLSIRSELHLIKVIILIVFHVRLVQMAEVSLRLLPVLHQRLELSL